MNCCVAGWQEGQPVAMILVKRPASLATAFAGVLSLLSVCVVPSAWSSGGARILFGGVTADLARSVYVTTPEGVRFEELTARRPYAASPAWSHGGESIAFEYSAGVLPNRIYVMDADGGNARRVTDGDGIYGDYGPAWSPRGDSVAFTSSREGSDRQGIYVVGLDGDNEVRISGLDTWAKWPSWRPAGDATVYASTRAGALDIHTMDSQGRHLTQLTNDRRWDMTPSWSPRGGTVAFASGGEADLTGDIYTVEADGSNRRRVTKHPSDDADPCWSPDGTQILFVSGRDGPQGLFIMDLDGRIVRRVMDGRFGYIEGSDWFDPDLPRSVSPLGRYATTWGWMKRLGARAR
jgi:TolB protein